MPKPALNDRTRTTHADLLDIGIPGLSCRLAISRGHADIHRCCRESLIGSALGGIWYASARAE